MLNMHARLGASFCQGLAIIGDGLQFINTLVLLRAEWKEAGSPEEPGFDFNTLMWALPRSGCS